ncbi:Dienelactone hydrolase endo--beta-D-glucanase [Mycena venus]|uniref:Dienelactone hydrolase endo--beta-D-glucanase n=1 Tax=Mycena venus TaxID=2733690 RepID=A0A8H6YW02_9AGAR|nr:Dienelactone hydrolase endo--beta-D-glucanase [Mycena venus]
MSFCDDCFKVVRHEGSPEGKTELLGGVKCYIATPTVDYPKDKVLIYLTDAFGMGLVNNLLLADDFARNGFKTIVPDMFNDDPVPLNVYQPDSTWDRVKWFSNHGPQQIRPAIDSVLAALKEQGVASFCATGYCLGARYVFDLAFDGIIQASAISHPGLLTPEDFEKYRDAVKAPLLINSCTNDEFFPLDVQAKADEILGNGKFAYGYRREYFEGCTHGFAIKADLSDPTARAGKEGSFKACVEWFLKYM